LQAVEVVAVACLRGFPVRVRNQRRRTLREMPREKVRLRRTALQNIESGAINLG
jgi:hypothetical protein